MSIADGDPVALIPRLYHMTEMLVKHVKGTLPISVLPADCRKHCRASLAIVSLILYASNGLKEKKKNCRAYAKRD